LKSPVRENRTPGSERGAIGQLIVLPRWRFSEKKYLTESNDMENIQIHRKMAKLGKINIFYRDTKTDGQTILCLHGRWGRGETWVKFIQHYGRRYRIIAPDQRGHGLSSKPISKYATKEMAEDMVSLLNHLKKESVVLVGHSMGGAIAGYIAAVFPEYAKALAILDKSASGPKNADVQSRDQKEPVDPITKDWPLPFSSLLEAQEYIQRDRETDLSYQYFMNSLMETVEGYQMMFSSQAMAANIANYEEWFDLLPGIQCPVLVLRANKSAAVNEEDFKKMKSLIADCLAYEMTNPDHNVHLSNEEGFYTHFDELLSRI
jgi:pimeloyl-ACP methyl ester carboxylesterase